MGLFPGYQQDFFTSLNSKFYENRDIVNATSERFQLPLFRSYGPYPTDTDLIARYRQEQEKIKALSGKRRG
jgi:hypothetical protein